MKSYNATPSKGYKEHVLQFLKKKKRVCTTKEIYEYIMNNFPLTDGDLAIKKDGSEPVWKNMVRRCIMTLKRTEQVISPKRGSIQLNKNYKPKVKKTKKAAKAKKAPAKTTKPRVKKVEPKVYSYRLEQYDELVMSDTKVPTVNDKIRVEMNYPAVLRWGINGWKTPPANLVPEGSWIADNVAETELVKKEKYYEVVLGPFNKTKAESIEFVIRYYDGGWSSDFKIKFR